MNTGYQSRQTSVSDMTTENTASEVSENCLRPATIQTWPE